MHKLSSWLRYIAIDRRRLLSLALAAGAAPALGWVASSGAAATARSGVKKVYAHWHWFPTSFDNRPPEEDIYADYLSRDGSQGKFRQEGGFIRQRPLPRRPRPESNWAVLDMSDEIKFAKDIGLDGFLFNIGSLDPDSVYMRNLRNMLEAANAAPDTFEVMLSIDAAIMKDIPVDMIAATILPLVENPSIARHSDGRLMLGAFAPEQWDNGRWKKMLDKMSAGGQKVYFLPTFLDVSKTFEFIDLIDGASMWGTDRLSEVQRLKQIARRVKRAGKAWASAVWPQDFRPKDRWFSEARNSELFRTGWQAAMEVDSDVVNICTWNDYSEGSEIRPSTSTQYAFYDLSSFYIGWFKAGRMPPVTEDVLYYFHRIKSTDAEGCGTAQPFRFAPTLFNRLLNPVANDIELLAFLKEPAEIDIVTEKSIHSRKAKSGITSFRTRLVPGKVSFRIRRRGATVLSLASAFEIREKSPYQDMLYHAGSSQRAPL